MINSGSPEYRLNGYTSQDRNGHNGLNTREDLSLYGTILTPSGDFDPYYSNPEMRLHEVDPSIQFLKIVRPFRELLEIKKAQGLNIVLVVPTINEGTKLESGESNIGRTLDNLEPLTRYGLFDRRIVVDSGSTDDTRDRVLERNVQFIDASSVLSRWGFEGVRGKGANLRIAVEQFNGPKDILVFCDADFSAGPGPLQAVVSPLIEDPNVQLSLSLLERITHQGGGPAVPGGRVTALTFRPLAKMFFPELDDVIQPIAGLYAGRGEGLKKFDFPIDYRVETALLVETLMAYGPEAIAQVYAGVKDQVGQSTDDLEKMASQIAYQMMVLAQKHDRVPSLEALQSREALSYRQHPIHATEQGRVIGAKPVNHRLVNIPSQEKLNASPII